MSLQHRLLTTSAAVALLLAACGDPATLETSTTTVPGASTTTSTAPASTTSPTTSTTVAPDPDGPGPSGASTEELAALVDVTEQIRGLEFLVDPTITVISGEDMAERVRQDLEEEIDPAEIVIDEAFFELIGILPADIDLAQAWIDLYSEQVAGFYDHETKELVVTGDSELTALGKSVVVHELVHALADQHFDLGATRDALVDEERYHEATALLALAEGEATYFQIVYFQSLPLEEQFAAAAEALEYDSSVLDSLPAWFGEDLGFPYDYGFVFVEALIALNGIAAVDQAYGRIPTTVEQIIHPEAYRTLEVSREVALPGNAILPGYDIYLEGEFGEWNLRLYLLDGVTDGDAIIASAGWGGDDHRILWNGTEVVFLYQFEGDTPRDAEELADALAESVAARMAVGNPSSDGDATTFYGDDFAWILLDGSTVYFVAASDRSAGETLAEVLTPGESGE